jgi:TPR repeat protein
MLRSLLAVCLLLAPFARGAESGLAKAEAEYRARRQAALMGQWMEVKLPFETPAAFVTRLLDTAREGDTRGMAALGWEFHQRKDEARGRSWLRKAAEGKNWFAAYLLGLLEQTPAEEASPAVTAPAKEPDEDTILPKAAPKTEAAGEASDDGSPKVDWMQWAADWGLAEAQFEIGLRYMQGKGVPLDAQSARQWYARAAERNYAPALCNLATMELQGTGGPADVQAAGVHFQGAAEAGFPQGSFGMGEAFRLQGNYPEAAAGYEQAAVAGFAEADFWLGCMASQALGQPRDEAKAAGHFVKAAEGGHLLSQAIAADLLRRGAGVAADPEAAAKWEKATDELTNADLVATIGSVYLEGRLVQRDFPRALRYFRIAAAQGQPVAQRWAGALLASGEAGERNLQEAYQWLWLAARNGQTEAEPAFKAVLQAMDGNQIMEAARRASDFQPNVLESR